VIGGDLPKFINRFGFSDPQLGHLDISIPVSFWMCWRVEAFFSD